MFIRRVYKYFTKDGMELVIWRKILIVYIILLCIVILVIVLSWIFVLMIFMLYVLLIFLMRSFFIMIDVFVIKSMMGAVGLSSKIFWMLRLLVSMCIFLVKMYDRLNLLGLLNVLCISVRMLCICLCVVIELIVVLISSFVFVVAM